MARRCCAMALLLAFLAANVNALKARSQTTLATNPIRRVVTMLQDMTKQVVAEGKRDQELYDKFMCYCSSGSSELEASITAAENKLPQVASTLEGAEAKKEQLEKDLAEHKESLADAKGELAKATSLREKEAAEYTKESSDLKTNIAAMGKAIVAIEKGTGSFLQTAAAAVLRRITIDMDMSNADRDMLSAFLSQGEGYAPQSGQIVGILKQMKETMEKSLADTIAEEEKAIADFEALVAAKTKEVDINTKSIEEKTQRYGEVGIEIVNLKEDINDTSKGLVEDKQFLANLDKDCATRKDEFEVVKKTRADELVALADTIKLLNSDDALQLFKKTLPSTSLLQTKVAAKEVRQRALRVLKAVRSGAKGVKDTRLDLITLALRGHKVSFEKMLTMIDEMVALLGKEQTDDDAKKAYCESELDKKEDELKGLEQTISDLEKASEEAKSDIATLAEDITALTEGIKGLDKSVAEATDNRKAEHEEYKHTLAEDTAAKEILKMATKRLNQFYNPKLALAQTNEVASLLQLASASGGAPPPPPETFGAYTKKGQESAGVLDMMATLEADLDKEIQEIEVEEKDAQSEYEELMQDSGKKRTADSKAIESKEGTKADLESQLEKMTLDKKSKTVEAYATAKTIQDLHLECDWLISNFETRKEARAGEIDALKNAKAVLSGADYSL